MKKITLLLTMFFLVAFSWLGSAQILNQAADWTNGTWSVTGTYIPAALLQDPGVDGNFSYDDDVAGNSGLADLLSAESLVIDLTAAAGSGETLLETSATYTFRGLGETLNVEYWDADASAWTFWHSLMSNSGVSDYKSCASLMAYTTGQLDISAFTPTQLSGFKYRFTYDDFGGNWLWGFCMSSPTIISVAPPLCENPTVTFSNSQTIISASWSAAIGTVSYDWELVPDGNAQGVGVIDGEIGTMNLFASITGLTGGTLYDLWIKSDCETAYVKFDTATTIGNDVCVDAITIICDDVLAGDTSTATPEAIGAFTGANEDANSVWYKFVGDGSAVTLSLCNDSGVTPGDAAYDTKIDVYTVCDDAASWIGGNDDNNGASCTGFSSLFEFTANMGTDYYIRIYGFDGGSSGAFNLSATCVTACAPLAANDDCVNAEIATNGVTVIGNNTCQTNALINPTCDGFGVINDVWFDYTTDAASAGLGVTLDFDDGTFTAVDVKFAIYSDCAGAGSQLLCDAANITAVENLISGVSPNTNLKFQVWSTTAGTFGLTIVDFIAPECVETPDPVDNIIDVVTTGGNVVVTWANAATGATPTAYEVSLGTATGVLTLVGVVDAPATTFTFTGLANTTEYFWQVIARNGGALATGCAEWSFTTETLVNDICGTGNIDLTVFASGASAGNEITADTSVATASAESATSCDSVGTNLDLFYSFTMPAGETAVNVLTTGVTGADIELVLKDACGGAEIAGTCLGNSGNHALTGLTAGTTYVLQVWHDSFNAGAFDIALELPPPPPANDTCLGATVIACGDDLLAETNVGSTDNGDDVGCTQGVGVWYKFIGNDMSVTITSTTDFDHEIGIASSADCVTFTPVSCTDSSTGTETTTFTANLGTDYYIYIGSFSNTSTATGTFGINVTCTVPLVNDICGAGNIDLTVFASGASAGNEITADTSVATASAESATSCDSVGTNLDLFYSFTMPAGETAVNVLTTGLAGADIELVLKDACGGAEIAGTCLGNSGNHSLTGLTAGTTYVLQVWHDSFNAGAFDIALELPPPPPVNDTCLTATVIACDDDLLAETNVGSTDNGDDVGCAQGVGVWYKYVGNDMDVTITSTTDFDHEIGVASSVDCVTFTNIICQDGSTGTETVTFSTVTGTDYYIYIGSFSNTSTVTGTFGINVACVPTPMPPANDDCANADTLTVGLNFGENALVGTNVAATDGGDGNPTCGTAVNDVWYSVIVPASGNVVIEVASDPGSSFNDSILAVYDGGCIALNEIACNDDEPGAPGNFSKVVLTGRIPGEILLARVFDFGNNTFGTFQVSAYDATCTGITKTWTLGAWVPAGTPTANDTVIIDDIYDTTSEGNIDACTLTVTVNGFLNVGPVTYVNVINDITVDAGSAFLVESQGSVVQVNDVATVTGTAADFNVEIITTVLQDSDRFTYFSSPTNNGTLALFSGFSTANWEFNATTQAWSQLGGADAMQLGHGYAVRGGANQTETIDFAGNFNNGAITVPLATDGTDFSNLVGNPYPSAINADNLISNNTIGAVYIWTHESGATSGVYDDDDYIECVIGTCTDLNNAGNTPSAYQGFIASGQGFFVTATAAGNLTFNNAMRVTGNNDQFRSTDDQKLWLNMTTEQGYDKQTVLTFTENGTADFDTKYEAEVFSNDFGLSFYSFNALEDKLSINDTGLLTNDRTIPLGFVINAEVIDGATISIAHSQNLEDTNVYLIDNLLNVTHDLKVSDYQISVTETGEVNNRFEIVFNRDPLSTNDDIITNDTLVVSNQNETQIKVNMLDGSIITNLKAFDVLGKLVIDMKANSNDFIINTNIKQGQVLFIKATLENGQVLSNKFMKL